MFEAEDAEPFQSNWPTLNKQANPKLQKPQAAEAALLMERLEGLGIFRLEHL